VCLTGTFINVAAITAGSLLGLSLKRNLPARVSETTMHGIALTVLFIGVNMAANTENIVIVLMSIIVGTIIGETLDIEEKLQRTGNQLQTRLANGNSNFTRAFVGSSLLFIVGPMAVIGSINDGLTGDFQLLLTKSIMDGIASIAFAASLGIGVLFSIIPVLVYQGALTLVAGLAASLFSQPVITEMTATGGVVIIGLALNMLEVTSIRVGNLLPALLVVILITKLASLVA